MRVLVASKALYPIEGDFNHCADGELVYLQDPCAADLRDPDGGCGCGRGFAGMNSHRGCTKATVVETQLSRTEVREALRSSLQEGGWLDPKFVSATIEREILDGLLHEVAEIAEAFPVGTQIRRRLSLFYSDPDSLARHIE